MKNDECYDVRTEDKTYDKLQNWCNAKQINWIVLKKISMFRIGVIPNRMGDVNWKP